MRSMTRLTSMRLAEHENERDNEELIAEVVVDVQDPAAPIFVAARLSEGSHDTGRVITRLSEVVDHGAAAIDQNLLRVGAVKIDLGHVQPPSNGTGSKECQRRRFPWVFSTGLPDDRSGVAVRSPRAGLPEAEGMVGAIVRPRLDVAMLTGSLCNERIDLARAVGSARRRQYPAAGAQGLPLLQGWVAKAPTRGSRRQILFPILRSAMLASSMAP
jgi:hypothetical protein